MTQTVTRDSLLAAIRRAYGSLSDPDYSFVSSPPSERYQQIVARLRRSFHVVETTDFNDDVSLRYLIEAGKRQWSLALSLVGPYAVLLRLQDPETPELVSEGDPPTDSAERALLAELREAGVSLLDSRLLEEPIAMQLPDADDDEPVLIYHAVVGDDPLLPWRSSPI